jgi:hypothetical protein
MVAKGLGVYSTLTPIILDAPDVLSTLGEILSWTPKVNAIIQEKTLFLTTGISRDKSKSSKYY